MLAILEGYYWTASTSFANPAITIARAMSDTFAGILPADVPGFIFGQIVGALAAFAAGGFLFARPLDQPPQLPDRPDARAEGD